MATTRAFDPHRAPDAELIADCVHCGFCLPTCPTYVLWGEEMDSPRGRIVLMDRGLKDGSSMSATMVEHLDRCLGCMACVTACPSGVQYDRLIEATRPQVERNFKRSVKERAWRKLVFATFTHPGRLRALVPAMVAQRRLGLARLRLPKRLKTLAELAPETKLSAMWRRVPAVSRPKGSAKARVGLLQGCVQRALFGHVNKASIDVLVAEGFEVHAPSLPRCCGALSMHSGEEPDAIELAKKTIDALEDYDFVAVNAAGCGSAMKHYVHLLSDEPGWADRAATFSAKVKDITELLAEDEPRATRNPIALTVTYHDACHVGHAQGIRAQPRALLAAIPGLEIVEPTNPEICCGSAGIYNLLQPDAARELGDMKAASLAATGARAVAAANPGCVLQITARLEAAGKAMPVYHPIELLDMSIKGGRP
jgi:glycolate oxidase iron-sulfur subunit